MTSEPPLLETPANGIPDVVDTAEELYSSITSLAAGQGPIAVDAERASGIRYGQRAFLVQLRRQGAGTFLRDSETLGDLSGLGPALGSDEWVIHSVTQDLPCLQHRGMAPAALFDTARAARLLGWDQFGLAAGAERRPGVRLGKGPSAGGRSPRPLPQARLNQAGLGGGVLLPIRGVLPPALLGAGPGEFAEQEFAHLLDFV